MKNVKFFGLTLASFAIFLTIFSSCSEGVLSSEQGLNQVANIQIEDADAHLTVGLEDGVLAFPDVNSYQSTVSALHRMNHDERLEWEKGIDFHSAMSAFDAIMDAEYAQTGPGHSALYKRGLEAGLIYDDASSGLYNLAVVNPIYASVLNMERLVKIGSDVYHFDRKNVRVWENTTVSDARTLLQSANWSTDGTAKALLSTNNNAAWFSTCEREDDRARITLSGYFFSDFVNPDKRKVLFIDYYIQTTSQIRNGQNQWVYDRGASISLTGSSTVRFYYTDGQNNTHDDESRQYNFTRQGAYVVFAPDQGGSYESEDPMFFSQPAELMSYQWTTRNQCSNGEALSCDLD